MGRGSLRLFLKLLCWQEARLLLAAGEGFTSGWGELLDLPWTHGHGSACEAFTPFLAGMFHQCWSKAMRGSASRPGR